MSVVTFVMSVRSKKFLAALTGLVSVATMLLGARIASADEVWFQSYPRASASDACVPQPGETPWQDSWGPNPGWVPSWEQWANNGQGGWVCSRSITWARDSTAPVRVYSIGEEGPGGGTVFFDAGSQQSWGRYLEAAPTDITPGTGMGWSGNTTVDPIGTGTGIGTGAANTQLIIDQGCETPPSTDCGNQPGMAATAAAAYSTPTAPAGQWFLPSQDELNAMCMWAFNDWTWTICNNDGSGGGALVNGGFASDVYWSSSQNYDPFNATAWYQVFVNGNEGSTHKSSGLRVRPVRAF